MDYKETLERMHHQKLYYCHNEELLARQEQCLDRLYDFNQTRPTEFQKRTELLKEMFAEIGEGCYIEPPLRANWGGTPRSFWKRSLCKFQFNFSR